MSRSFTHVPTCKEPGDVGLQDADPNIGGCRFPEAYLHRHLLLLAVERHQIATRDRLAGSPVSGPVTTSLVKHIATVAVVRAEVDVIVRRQACIKAQMGSFNIPITQFASSMASA